MLSIFDVAARREPGSDFFDVTFAGIWDASAYNAFVISPASESTNLAVAEYVKVFGAMYNKEAAANKSGNTS